MFTISQGKGFQITFANGWRISVQFGVGNYCDRSRDPFDIASFSAAGQAKAGAMGSSTAEVAVFDPQHRMIDLSESDQVLGWQTPDEVAALIAATAARPA